MGVRVAVYLSLSGRGWGGVGHLFNAGRLLTFSTLEWGLVRGWALIRINTVSLFFLFL